MGRLAAALIAVMVVIAPALAATFEALTLNVVTYHCTSLDSLAEWFAFGNKYGPTALDRASEFKGCSKDAIAVEAMQPLGFAKGFGLPMVVLVARTSKGEVFSFVPALPTIPVPPGTDA